MKTTIYSTIRTFLTSRLSIVMAAFVALAVTTGVSAYGPERETFTTQNAAPYITFNSITNNGQYGDERNFMLVKDASITTKGDWKDEIAVEDGKEYLVRILVHNNAKPQLNLTATNTRVAVNVPTNLSNKITLDAFLRADNAKPKEIWDNAVMTSDKKFNVAYVAGSAYYVNQLKPTGGGFTLSDSIVTNGGALVGYESMDGNVPGCFEYSGYAIFKVKVTMNTPNFTMHKKVRLHGTDKWHDAITAQPGQKVDYQIYYENTGEANQDDVVAIDKLPQGVTYKKGSTTLRNASNADGDGLAITSNDLVTKGINIGNYAPVSNAYVRFTATLPEAAQLEACGAIKLVNTGTIVTQNGEKSDVATVTITKECGVDELPQTGPIEVIAGLAGVAAITFGAVYYFKSRRELDKAVLDAQTHTHVKTGKAPIDPPVAHEHEHKSEE